MAPREKKIIVRLSEARHEEFQRLADELGLTMSALGAFVIGNFLRTQKKVMEPFVEEMGETAKQFVMKAVEVTAEAKEGSA